MTDHFMRGEPRAFGVETVITLDAVRQMMAGEQVLDEVLRRDAERVLEQAGGWGRFAGWRVEGEPHVEVVLQTTCWVTPPGWKGWGDDEG